MARQNDADIEAMESRIEERIDSLRADIDALNKSMEGLLLAWRTATGVVAFVKWASTAMIVAGVAWKMLKQTFKDAAQ